MIELNDDILLRVQKPGRYIGDEVNAVVKDAPLPVNFAFCFPDVYEVGMSCLGLQILYFLINRRTDARCECVFAPWPDMEDKMRELNMPLFTLESREPVKDFDFMGFTLQYEMSYTNVVNMLDLAGVPPFADERGEDCPVVCAGGPCAVNPEPLAGLMDFFYIGDGEQSLDSILDIYARCKRDGFDKRRFLEAVCGVEGVYVPRFYECRYDGADKLIATVPNRPGAPAVIRRAVIKDLDAAFFPDTFIVPNIEIVHDRVSVEPFRGCGRGCRFCQSGFINRPVRERLLETLLTQADALINNTGHEEISLVSLSTADYSQIDGLTRALADKYSSRGINITLPSLRADAFTGDLAEKLGLLRRGHVTIAPEAGSQRLRDAINKKMGEGEILDGCRAAFTAGIERVKLYFMVGLPAETYGDIDAIAVLIYKILRLCASNRLTINVSSGCFVPKPHTPFQWEAQDMAAVFDEKQARVKAALRNKRIKFNYQDGATARIEAALARGDRRVLAAIIGAWRRGARFEGWADRFDYGRWEQAFDEAGLSIDFYTTRKRAYTETLPWDHIDTGVDKRYMIAESVRASFNAVTNDCGEGCAGCGLKRRGQCDG